MQPCGEAGVREVMLALMLTKQMPGTNGMSEATQQGFYSAKIAEYSRLLGHVPLDILKTSADLSALESPFFPFPADLMKHADPLLGHRQRQQKRILDLIKRGGRPEVVKPFVEDTQDVKLRTLIAAAMRRGQVDKAAGYERELAKIEHRDPEAWSLRDEQPSIAAPVTKEFEPAKPSPGMTKRLGELATAWRAPPRDDMPMRTGVIPTREEPPDAWSDEIPE